MSDLNPDDLRDIGTTLTKLADELREPGSLRRITADRIAHILDNVAEELAGHAHRLAETPVERTRRETHEVAVKAASGQRRPKDRVHYVTGEVLAGAWELGKS
jgi:predicted nucleic acid-binding protein